MLNLDTHILIFLLTDQLTAEERRQIDRERCGISQMVLWEIANLRLIGRIQLSPRDPTLRDFIRTLIQWPVSIEVVSRMEDLDFDSDPADEIIAATSLAFDVPLLTRDRRLRNSKVIRLA